MSEDAIIAARRAAHQAEEALSAAVSRYTIGYGIRPPNSRGKLRGVAREIVPGGGMELWSCQHDHATGLHDVRQVSSFQRRQAQLCAADWLDEQIQDGRLPSLPIETEPE